MYEKLEAASTNADTVFLWKGTFSEFLVKYKRDKKKNPNIGVLAHQRVYNMILAAGTKRVDHFGKERTRYAFFEDTLFGVEDSIDAIMSYFHSAAQRTETSRRMLLMYGPPSSGKSTIVHLLKRGLEDYSRSPEGAIYALANSGMHENPFLLVPSNLRGEFEEEHGLRIEGKLSPSSAYRLQDEFNGKFMDYPVEQIYLSEATRRGIGTWLPQDPKTVSTDTTRVFVEGQGIVRLSSVYSSVGNTDLYNPFVPDGSDSVYGSEFTASAAQGDEKIKGIYNHGHLPMFRANMGGVWIDCTSRHRLMTLNKDGELEWKRLQEIDDNTPVVVKTGMRKFGKDKYLSDFQEKHIKLTPQIAEVVGGLVSEGACTSSNFFYCNTNQFMIDRFMGLVKDSLSIEPAIQKEQTSESFGSDEDAFRGVRFSAEASRWLEYNFNVGCGACDKKIPDNILGASELTQIAFLEGLCLGDGSIRFKKGKVARFSYSTCSETLAMDVQAMLLNLGIFTRISRYVDQTYPANTQYQVVSEGSEVYKIAQMLPIFSKHRKFEKVEQDHRPRYEYFGSLSGLIKEIRAHTKGTRDLIDRRYCISTENSRTPTRATLEKWRNELSDNIEWTSPDKKEDILGKIDTILSNRCVKMLSTEYIGMVHGVDLSCDSDTFSYVSNGVISHNSSDQSELVGSLDFAKIQEFGDEADPRAYNFNGELNVANRGIMEFIEGLKSDERFLRVLLTATEEKSIKAPRFGLIYCDSVIILHSNEEEFKGFMGEKRYEAYHDRMNILKVPTNLSVNNEIKIYEKLLKNSDALKDMHIAPKTLSAAAMVAVLSRLTPPPEGGELTLIKKMKLYDKQHVRGYKVEQVPDMKRKESREGMEGVSPRFIIDQISASIATARDENRDYITALDVLRQLNRGVFNRDSFTQEKKNHYESLIDEARGEWDDLLRNDIQKAFFVSYENEARNLCENYFDQIEAACAGVKPRDPITGDEMDLDDKLMDSIEGQIDITSSGKEDFRNEILRAVGAASRKGVKFDYTNHAQLREAIQKKLFEERKNVIRMTVSTRNPDPEELKRINDVVARMVDQQGYSTGAANALLKYATAYLFDK